MALLEIAIAAYQRPRLLTTLLWSLASQTSRDFQISVWHDGASPEILNCIEHFQKLNEDISISYCFTQIRHNDYGHSLRSLAIDHCQTEFMLLTNDDNYYVPIFVEQIVEQPLKDLDIVFFDMVHSHKLLSLPNTSGYQTLVTQPRINWIDIGAFVFRTELGKQTGFKSRDFAADGVFFESMLRDGARCLKIEKVLFVHN